MQFLETHHNAQFVISESAISEDRDGVGQPRNTQSSIMLRESLLAADDSSSRSRRRPSVLVHTAYLQHVGTKPLVPPAHTGRAAIIMLSLLSTAMYAGIIFGWSSFSSLLLEEGFYSADCDTDDPPPCAAMEQSATISFAIGSTTLMLSSLPSGLLVDHAPPSILVASAGSLLFLACFLLGVLPATTPSIVIHIVFALLSGGGQLAFLTAFHAVELIPDHDQCAWFVSVLSGLSSLSAAIPLGFVGLRSLGISRAAIFVAFGALAALICSAWAVLWHIESREAAAERAIAAAAEASSAMHEKYSPTKPKKSRSNNGLWHKLRVAPHVPGLLPGLREEEESDAEATVRGAISKLAHARNAYKWYQMVDLGRDRAAPDFGENTATVQERTQVPPLEGRPLKEQVCSLQFTLDCGWLAMSLLRINLYVASVHAQLTTLHDKHGYYQSLFVGLMPAGIAFVGLSPFFVSRFGLLGALQAGSCLGLAFSCASLVPDLGTQVVTFVLLIAYRTLSFSLHTIYVCETFGHESMSTILGIAFVVCAFPNACAPLITSLVANSLGGSWALVNLASAAIGVVELGLIACVRARW